MRNFTLKSVRSRFLAFALVVAAMMVPGLAHAQGTGGTDFLDYAELAGGARTELGTAIGTFAPVVIGIVVSMVALALLIKWVKKGAKSA